MKQKNIRKICGLILFLFVSCNHNSQEKELYYLNAVLDSIITEQYNSFKTMNLDAYSSYRTDSIYLQGNRIIRDIDKENFQEKYTQFNNEYGDKRFKGEKWDDKELLKAKMRIIQLYSLNRDIQSFYQSHFQVDMIGFVPKQKEIQKNKHEVVEIIPAYISSEIKNNPLVIIGSDTLENTSSTYLFKCFLKNKENT